MANEIIEAEVLEAGAVTKAGDSFRNLYQRFVDYVDAAPKTIATYRQNLKPFVSYIMASGTTSPSRDTIRSYRDHLQASGLKAATIKSYMAVVKVFFSWLDNEGLFPNVAKSIKTPKAAATHTSDYLTPVQAANLLKTIKDTHTKAAARDYVMCNLVLALGMRTIEIERANVGHLHQKNGMWFLEIHGKGGKNVAKKIDDGVAAMLLEYLQGRGAVPEDAPLFAATSNHQGTEGRIPAKSISRIIKGHLVHAGINSSRITAHSLRHTAAMFKLKACNGNLKETQEFMRHSDPKTTMIYLDAINAEKDTSSADVMAMIHAAM
jgi:integrase/recombinase XerC